MLDFQGIRNTILVIRVPYNDIEHYREDDPVSKLPWLVLLSQSRVEFVQV